MLRGFLQSTCWAMLLLALAVSVGVVLTNGIGVPRREPSYPAGAGELQAAVGAG